MAMSRDRWVVLQDCVLVIAYACCFEVLLRSFSARRLFRSSAVHSTRMLHLSLHFGNISKATSHDS